MYKNKKLKKYHFYISIETRLSVHCWSTFGSDYSLESSWIWRVKLGKPVFGEFLPFFFADPLKLCQFVQGALLNSSFQVSTEMFDRVKFWALNGPLRDIQRLIPKTFFRCLGFVLSVIVLLEGKPLPQSEVLSSLDQVFIKDLSVLCSDYLCLTSLSIPTTENIPSAWCCHHHASL